jgi:hypothetical protein
MSRLRMPVRAGSYPSSQRCAVARKAIYWKRLVLALKLMPGDPVTGGWWVVCGLPSLIRVPLYVLSPRGVSLWRIIEACVEDGMHKHLPGKPDLLRFDA